MSHLQKRTENLCWWAARHGNCCWLMADYYRLLTAHRSPLATGMILAEFRSLWPLVQYFLLLCRVYLPVSFFLPFLFYFLFTLTTLQRGWPMDGLYALLDYFASFSPYKPSGAPFQGLVICSHQCLSHVTSLTWPTHSYYLCLSLVTSHISLKFLDLYCEMFLSFIFYLFLFFFLCFFVSSFLPFSFLSFFISFAFHGVYHAVCCYYYCFHCHCLPRHAGAKLQWVCFSSSRMYSTAPSTVVLHIVGACVLTELHIVGDL